MSRAFVLSGGASLGAIQVGMLQAVFECGIAPDLIVATSAGAINGAFIATREPTIETALDLAEAAPRRCVPNQPADRVCRVHRPQRPSGPPRAVSDA